MKEEKQINKGRIKQTEEVRNKTTKEAQVWPKHLRYFQTFFDHHRKQQHQHHRHPGVTGTSANQERDT